MNEERERMTDSEFRMHLDKARLLATLSRDLDADGCLYEIGYADDFGVYFQPTEWIAGSDNRRMMRDLFRAIKPLVDFAKGQEASS